ncbi:MAG TPA: YraN family protein [Euzebyales bacterium]
MGRSAQLGRDGEQAAASYVAHLGWCVLARNWRPSGRELRGELDIVAVDGRALVLCEVKTRRGTAAGHPIASVTPRKLAQLRRLAGAWLAEHPTSVHRDVRFDILGLLWPDGAVAPVISHHRDVGR